MRTRPAPLPFCAYPTAADVDQHGIQSLPEELPVTDLSGGDIYRSHQHRTTPAVDLSEMQLIELTDVLGHSFGRRDVMCRHLQPGPPPAGLAVATHRDPLGSGEFGPWTTAQLMTWFIRLLALTDPTSPRDAVMVNEDVRSCSLVTLDDSGRVIGGAINETMPPPDLEFALREDDPFLEAVLAYIGPILEMLSRQDAEATTVLADRYPAFADALTTSRVGHHFMIARGDELPRDDAFELVAGTMEHFRDASFSFVIVEASNQWTGAACEALGGVRVHFAPYRTQVVVPISGDGTTSPDGFLSDKDSGCMLYLHRLAG
jgi:hypothetical protein